MSILRKITTRTCRRTARVRAHLSYNLPRVSVFKSLKHMYAQLIDDKTQKTLASCSSLELTEIQGDKKAVAHTVGEKLAQKALAQGITSASLDRGPSKYHGRVKALAEGLRSGGLKI